MIFVSAEQGKIKWDNNWTTFLESMLQLHLARLEKQQYYAINHIQKVIIDPIEQENAASKCNENAGSFHFETRSKLFYLEYIVFLS